MEGHGDVVVGMGLFEQRHQLLFFADPRPVFLRQLFELCLLGEKLAE
jgi:hypothetical protein